MEFSDFGHYLLEQDNVRILCGYMESIRNGPGFVIPSMSDDLRQKLASMLPKFGSLNNPLDMTGGTSLNGKLMADCLREMLTHDAFDAVLLCVNLIWREGKVLMQELAQLAATASKPFAVSWVAPDKSLAASLQSAPIGAER